MYVCFFQQKKLSKKLNWIKSDKNSIEQADIVNVRKSDDRSFLKTFIQFEETSVSMLKLFKMFT